MARQRSLRNVAGLGLALWLTGALASCALVQSPSPAAFFLEIANIDGPTVNIQINGTSVGNVACYAKSGAGDPTFSPSSAQPLPWSVVVLAHGGSVIGTFQESGDSGPRVIFVRPGGVSEGAYGANPGPAPAPTCMP